MRRLFEPCGGVARQDVLAAADCDMDSDEEDLSSEAWAARQKAKKARKDSPRRTRSKLGWANRVKGGGQVSNGFHRRAGERNRRYTCGCERHLASRCPQRRQWKPDSAPSPPPVNKPSRSSFSWISIGKLASVCTGGAKKPQEGNGQCEQSFSTALEACSQLVCTREESVGILDAGATANLVCFRRLRHHNSMMGQVGLPRVSTYPAPARFKFGDGRMGNVKFAADITVGIAGYKGTFTAFALVSDIPALLRNGALEDLRGRLDFPRDTLTPGFRGVGIPLKVRV